MSGGEDRRATLIPEASCGSCTASSPYDLAFSWDEDRLYCTELVAKAYEEATGWEIGTRRSIRSWQISDPRIEKAMVARGMNLDEQALAPVDLLDDPRFIDPTKPTP